MMKNLQPTIDLLMDLSNPADYSVNFPEHHLDGRTFELIKSENVYEFSSSSPIKKGIQTHEEIEFDKNSVVLFSKANRNIYIKGHYILNNKIEYLDEPLLKLFKGNISSFSSVNDNSSFNEHNLRMVIPVEKSNKIDFYDLQRDYFKTPQNKSFNYIPLDVDGEEYHFYNYSIGQNHYICIDCQLPGNLTIFQKKCFNILLAYSVIHGKLIHNECYIFSYENEEMAVPENFLYHSMRASVITAQGVFTTKVLALHSDTDFERDDDGMIKKEIRDKLMEDIYDFPISVFSNLSTVFYKYEKLQRAALIFVQSHISALEVKIPNYYVAIEAITGHIVKELVTDKKNFSPITDTKLANELIKLFKEQSLKVKTDYSLSDEEFNMEIFEKNLNKLNAPPNANKLADSFDFFGYTLSKEQKGILIERNRFLHGSFVKIVDDDKEFREALHVALRLHFMVAFLLLKIAGFEGRIINYAELWSHVTEKALGEERLVKI